MPAFLATGPPYCYSELTLSFLAVALNNAGIIAPIRGGMARLSWPG